ncbi:MAG TPA: lysophospholipid acyltransferase family protein [Pseudomonadales bacterium]
MLSVRAALFYAGYSLATIVWGTLGTLLGWLFPYRLRFRLIIGCWTWFCLFWLRVTCGVRVRVLGRENVPERPCIVLCRHESTWETLFLQQLFAPQATLIKRELLHIPFFGWAYRTLRPIAIDRRRQRKALRTLIDEGRARLEQGIWVVLFPEGTRMPAGQLGRFQPGGAALAAATGAPVLLIAHDAGSFWPAHRFLKYPGEVTLLIDAPIETAGLSSKEIQALIAERFAALMRELPGRAAVAEPPAALPSGAAAGSLRRPD